ncbi:MAG: insulinase family protein [Magnetospirillum sp. WYHS-4]
MARGLLLFGAALLAAVWNGQAAAAVFNPETFTLANGMQVVAIANPRVPVVTHMVWYRVGGADEPPGKSGIAHFLEHLMFKGTAAHPNGEFSATVARLGGQENAFTSHDYTGFYQTIAVDRLETVMALEADRMVNLTLTPEIIEPERQVILEERRLRVENNPGAVLREQAEAALYLNHPYGRPVIGWMHEIEGLTVDDIMAFYRRWYAPNNAVLVVAGDITAAKLKPLAEKYYGVLPVADTPPRRHPAEPPPLVARRVLHADARVRQPSWARMFLAPGLAWGDTALAPALDILAEALGGGSTSRLYRKLVVERAIAVNAGTSYSAEAIGPAEFTLHASPAAGLSLEAVETAVEAELAQVLKEGLAEAEVTRAKSKLLADGTYARDSLTAGAHSLGAALARGFSVATVEDWPDRLRAVTLEQVNAAARAVLGQKASVTSLLMAPKEEGAKP